MACSASQSVLGKSIYENEPELTTFQMLTLRSLLSSIFNILYLNVNAKAILWDSVPPECFTYLIHRTLQLNISVFITYHSINNPAFALTTVSLVDNCAVFFIVLFGVVFFSERVSFLSLFCIAAAYGGTMIVLLNGEAPDDA